MKRLLLLVSLITATSLLVAQPSNDDCTGAIIINIPASGNACVNSSTATATDLTWGSATCGQTVWTNDVWYTFVSAGTLNTITVTPTGGTGAAQQLGAAVFTGGCGSLNGLGSYCQISATAGGSISINQTSTPGTQYWIEVSSFGAPGTFQLCINSRNPAPSPGSSCATATTICSLDPFTLGTGPAGTTTFIPDCFTFGANSSVWYQFTSATAGTLAWQATPSIASTELDWALYDITALGGCPGTTSIADVCNYNFNFEAGSPIGMSPSSSSTCPTSGSAGAAAEICPSITTIAGHTYALLVDNFSTNNSGWNFNFNGSTFQMPVAKFTVSDSVFCGSGGTVTFNNLSVGAITTTLNFGDGSPAVVNPTFPISHNYSSIGNYAASLSITTAAGCPSVAVHSIIVNNNPSVSVDTVNTCSGTPGTLHTTVSPTNGTYQWSSGGGTNATASFSPTTSTDYTVTYTENSCTASATGRIIVQPAIDGGPNQSATCVALPGGSVTMAAVDPGTWSALSSNPGTANIVSPAAQNTVIDQFSTFGVYRFEYTDGVGCPDTVSVTVSGNPDAGTNQTVTCAVLPGGSATMNGIGIGSWVAMTGNPGTANIVTPNSPTTVINTFSAAGTYSFIFQSGSCADTTQIVVTAKPQAGTDKNLTCATLPSGSVTMSATGTGTWSALASNPGTATITNPSSATTTINNFSTAGNYLFEFSNGSCTDTALVTVTAKPDAGLDQQVNCVALPGGSATMAANSPGNWSAISGNPGVAIIANPALPNTTISNFTAAGTFYFLYTSGTCFDTARIIVTAKPNAGPDTSTCIFGSAPLLASGTGNWSAAPGNPGSAIIANAASANTTASGFSVPGNYLFIFTSGGCDDTMLVVVRPLPTIGVLSDTVCQGTTAILQSINALPAGGSYSWNNGSTSDSLHLDNLPVGTNSFSVIYTVNGCSANAAGVAFIRATPTVVALDTQVCSGYGAAPYANGLPAGGTYLWSTGSASNQIAVTPVNTTDYYVSYTESGCTAVDTATVTVNPNPVTNIVVTPAICTAFNGTAKVFTTSGTPAYHYVWNVGGVGDVDSAGTLAPGAVSVTVTDSRGCVDSATNTITIVNTAVSISLVDKKDIRCHGGTDGFITVDAAPAGTYSYIWNSLPIQNTASATALPAGNYSVTATDINGCSALASFTLTQQPALTLPALNTVNPTCYDGTNGAATANPSGGTGNYTYLWTPTGQQTATASGLHSGNYTVVVTDDSLCTISGIAQLFDPAQFFAFITATNNVSCNGLTNGSATVGSAGGVGTLTYNWSTAPVQNTPTASGLSAGTYDVIVTDGNSCTATSTASISEPELLSVSLVVDKVKCNGGSDGAASASATGGTPTYTYDWNNGASGKDLTGLQAATYTVTVTDLSGCTATASMAVVQPEPLLTLATSARPRCVTSYDGTMDLTTTGGTPPYRYDLILNDSVVRVQTSSPVSGLAGGDYRVVTLDLWGCVDTMFTGVPIVSANTFAVLVDSTSCYGPEYVDGALRIEPQNFANGPFRFRVDNRPMQYEQDFFDLASGIHQIEIIDSFGCDTVFTVVVPEPLPGVIDIQPDGDTILLGESLQLNSTFLPYGAGSVVSYQWTPQGNLSCNDCQNPVATPYQPDNTYRLTIVYNNGCVASSDVRVYVLNNLPFFIPNAFSPNGDGSNDEFQVYGSGLKTVTMRVFNRWGEKVFDSTGSQLAAWDGMYKGVQSSPGVYTYSVELVYLDDKKEIKSGSVTLVR
ncbi:MAG: gliding motility-associated C-terminal domain-containing protein [Chitinophagales bacterium]